MKTRIEVSLRDAKKAFDAINDCSVFRNELQQIASNEWEYEYHDDEDENDMFFDQLQNQFRLYGVEEYEIVEQ